MAWALAVSAVLNLTLVVAWMDAAEGKRYYGMRLKTLQRRLDYWQLRAIGKQQMTAKKGA